MKEENREQTIEEWLDEKIVAYELLGKEFNPTGKEDYWKCPRCINVHTPDKEIHIDSFEKIFPLLKDPECVLNRQVKVDDKVYLEQAFTYKGYKFFDWREMK